MSYILDALKRADADRERGHVPGLHSQGKNHPATAPGASWHRQTVWAIAVLVLLAAAVLTWWSLRAPDTPMAPDVRTAAASVEPPLVDAAPPTTPSLPILSPEPPVEAHTPAPARPPSTPPRLEPSRAKAEAVEEAMAADAVDTADAATETEDTVDSVTTPPPQTTLPPRPAAARPVATTDASGRPTVRVSGSSYSKNPAHRMLIANGKVVHEGQEIEPGLRLETVGPRSAVLNHRGTLYNITY
ncbi:MAG: general secretion pathway protein GspB [Hydrogenophaga sp.]|nr:general secretion pathway protein GspB [Hydrogenophaga sp.]